MSEERHGRLLEPCDVELDGKRASVTVEQFESYLTSGGWERESSGRWWRLSNERRLNIAVLLLPGNRSMVFEMAIRGVARLEGYAASGVLAAIAKEPVRATMDEETP